jgi:hypothetical protein
MVAEPQVAALRALLTRDDGVLQRLDGEAGSSLGGEFAVLVGVAFVLAARQHFGSHWAKSDLVRFVGQLRAGQGGEFSDVNAGTAEQLLISALTNEPLRDMSGDEALGYAQAAVLAELTRDYDSQQLDTFLGVAREQANQWLATGWSASGRNY